MLDLTIGALLDQQAAVFPDKEALVYHYPELGLTLRWTYRQYLTGVLLYAQAVALDETVADAMLPARQASITPHDVAQILYTSGTTGFPKAVTLTHHQLINQAHLSCWRTALCADERFVTPMPFFHIGGCLGGVLYALSLGCTLIPMLAFDAARQLELMTLERATVTANVPTMLTARLNHARFRNGEFALTTLRTICTGGAPVPVALIEQVKAEMGAECTVVFGQTESSGAITQTTADDSYALRSTTVGTSHPHMEITIVNPQTGDTVGCGESGALLTRGFLVMQGYYLMPEQTAETIDAAGWLHTGDLATMNAQGYITIVGRVQDRIVRGGELVYPAEVEAFLMRHPQVAEAHVVGVPDAVLGEEVVALLRLKPVAAAAAAEMHAYCQAGRRPHQVPRHIRFMTSFPLTGSGKVKKFELRAQLMRELGLAEE